MNVTVPAGASNDPAPIGVNAQGVVLINPSTGAAYAASGGGGGSLPSTVYSGQQTATGSAVALATQALTNSIAIVALSTNTGTVYVGGAGVTSANGYPLAPGQAIGYSVNNANAVYIVGTGSVAWTGN